MCGIAGIWNKAVTRNKHDLSSACMSMADSIKHRGPDGGGLWNEPEMNLFLAHRRLSILDLTSTGRQPMVSHDGRYVIVYNGEIYNHRDIRAELNAISFHGWRGTSDTETMLEAIATWGIEIALQRFNGMFAFALWDRLERVLFLARDRLGEKPLYYGWLGDCFAFASELKALRAAGSMLRCPSSVFEIDPEAINLFIRYQYVPVPWSIYKGIRKLPPAHFLSIPQHTQQSAMPESYWCLSDIVRKGIENPFAGDVNEGIEELEQCLKKAVSLRMEADVPLGAFLSGGIDSSAIVSMMQASATKPVRTFSIAFSESRYDESKSARGVAEHLSTEHTELSVTPQDALDVIPQLTSIYDEPFADASQIPTCLLSRLTHQHVTVALSGDGGDELFGGYYRHFMAPILMERFARLPQLLRELLTALAGCLPESSWHGLFEAATRIRGKSWQTVKSEGRIQKLFAVLQAQTADDMYRNLLSYWEKPEDLLKNSINLENSLAKLSGGFSSLQSKMNKVEDITCQIMMADALSYLPDDILVKVDRASMASSLEARVPFLDHDLLAFVWSLPLKWKIRGGKGKWILKQVLKRYLPESFFERPKTGFAVPIEHWLRNDLRDWAESLIDETRLTNQGIFNPAPIQAAWREHLSGKYGRHYHLWPILVIQSWLDHH